MEKIITEKHCNKCNQNKSALYFYKDKNKKDGLMIYCKNCCSETAKASRRLNPEKHSEYRRKWKLNNQEKSKSVARNWVIENIERVKEKKREWTIKNKDKVLELKRMWQKKNKDKVTEYNHTRRALKLKDGGKITAKEWRDLKTKYNNTCLCCGRNDVKLTLDHVVPISPPFYGKNTIDNAQPLCGICNSSKGAKVIDYRVKFQEILLAR